MKQLDLPGSKDKYHQAQTYEQGTRDWTFLLPEYFRSQKALYKLY